MFDLYKKINKIGVDKVVALTTPSTFFFREKKAMFNYKKYEHLINSKFGKLKIIEIYQSNVEYKRRRIIAICLCECGITKHIILDGITRKGESVVSCGCKKKEGFNFKHGLKKHPLYKTYYNMINRCYDSKNKYYHRYGGRGITINNEWLASFVEFYDFCIKNGWKKGLTIDRTDNNYNYEPSNCRFVTQKINCQNTSVCRPIKGTCKKTGKKIFYRRTGECLIDGFQPSNVSSALKGKLKSSGGYRWEYND